MPILAQETSEFPGNLFDDFQVDNDSESVWWAIYTRSRCEKAVARELLANEIPFYLPLIPKQQFIRGRRLQSYLPLFSGYLFLYGTNEQRVRALSVNRHRISTVMDVVDQSQLSRDLRDVRELIAADAPLTVESRLESGDRVRITKGSLQGLEGTVIRRKRLHATADRRQLPATRRVPGDRRLHGRATLTGLAPRPWRGA